MLLANASAMAAKVMLLVQSITCLPAIGQDLAAAGSGDAYIAEVLSAMERRANVTAKLRQQSRSR